MTNWTIRPAKATDAVALAHCIDAAYAGVRTQIPSLPDVSGGIDEDIRDHHVWVADTGNAIIGGAILILTPDMAKLANLAVHPDWGGQGLGRELIAVTEAHARESGVAELNLATHIDMPQNVKLYERLGWRVLGRSGVKVHMSKAL